MKEHYCSEEHTLLSYEGECNWCGEKEHANMSPKQIQKLAGHRTVSPWIIKLVQDAIEAEREACAKVCDEESESWNEFDYACGEASATKRCAAAIRARGDND